MDTISIEIWLGVFVFVIALAGGALGTITNIRNAKGPKERAFVIRSCAIIWGLVIFLLAAVTCLPSPYRYIVLVAFLFVFPVFIYRMATLHQLIRVLEHRNGEDEG
ncbi:MAG: hypothetical protein JXB04_11430 [Kiritimatiellae bacterium]|nr:hypothetical protein [Kiritimatiellia bacterium]